MLGVLCRGQMQTRPTGPGTAMQPSCVPVLSMCESAPLGLLAATVITIRALLDTDHTGQVNIGEAEQIEIRK